MPTRTTVATRLARTARRRTRAGRPAAWRRATSRRPADEVREPEQEDQRRAERDRSRAPRCGPSSGVQTVGGASLIGQSLPRRLADGSRWPVRSASDAAFRRSRSKFPAAYATKSTSSVLTPCWRTPHIASRKSETTRISVRRARRVGSDRAVVGRQQDLVLVRRQLVVDAEVAEVEERVAHPGVFPVDDPDPRPVVDEVGVEQVVVARPELDRVGQEGALDPAPDGRRAARTRAGSGRRGPSPAPGTPRRSGAARTGPGIAGPSWIRRSESATRRSVSGRWTASSETGDPTMNRVTR